MDYNELINKAIKKNEVARLLRGEQEYEIEVSRFTSDIFPTDINMVLVNCFYKQKDNIKDIGNIFCTAVNELLLGTASDVYIAILYFDTCIFHEEKNNATFLLDKQHLAKKIQAASNMKKDDLQGGLPNEAFCINESNNTWEVYYSERGNKSQLKMFESEEEACNYFYDWIMKILKKI